MDVFTAGKTNRSISLVASRCFLCFEIWSGVGFLGFFLPLLGLGSGLECSGCSCGTSGRKFLERERSRDYYAVRSGRGVGGRLIAGNVG